jgi:hypothetical protein
MKFWIFVNPVRDEAVKVQNVPRQTLYLMLAPTRLRRGNAAAGGMPGAFCTGMVKVQQGFAAEVLQISRSERHALLNFCQSREKVNGENF